MHTNEGTSEHMRSSNCNCNHSSCNGSSRRAPAIEWGDWHQQARASVHAAAAATTAIATATQWSSGEWIGGASEWERAYVQQQQRQQQHSGSGISVSEQGTSKRARARVGVCTAAAAIATARAAANHHQDSPPASLPHHYYLFHPPPHFQLHYFILMYFFIFISLIYTLITVNSCKPAGYPPRVWVQVHPWVWKSWPMSKPIPTMWVRVTDRYGYGWKYPRVTRVVHYSCPHSCHHHPSSCITSM